MSLGAQSCGVIRRLASRRVQEVGADSENVADDVANTSDNREMAADKLVDRGMAWRRQLRLKRDVSIRSLILNVSESENRAIITDVTVCVSV